MLRLALRQLQVDIPSTLLTVVALGAVIAVVLVLQGFEQGQYYQLDRLVRNRRADLIATQAGIANFTAVRSSIPQTARQDVDEVEGVAGVHPLTTIPIIYEKDGKRTPVTVLVYDTAGGPVSITRGEGIRDGRDIVIDESLAKKYGIEPGDSFVVSDFQFTVSGFTKEAAFMMPFAFISYDGMIDLYLESQIAPDLSTFPLLSDMLIEVDSSADRDAVIHSIEEQVPSVDVFTTEDLAARDVALGRAFFGPIMGLLVSVAYIIGLLVIGLIMYADVRGQLRTFAVLKALGFSQAWLFGMVVGQALLLLAISLPAGVLLANGLSSFIETAAPLYMIRPFVPAVLEQTLAASLAFAILGSLIPLHLMRRVDPMIAFEGV